MSRKNNVNPDHYKSGGRDRQNDTVPARKRPVSAQDDKERERWEEKQKEKNK